MKGKTTIQHKACAMNRRGSAHLLHRANSTKHETLWPLEYHKVCRNRLMRTRAASRDTWLKESAHNLQISQEAFESTPKVPQGGRRDNEEWRFTSATLERILGMDVLDKPAWPDNILSIVEDVAAPESKEEHANYHQIVLDGNVSGCIPNKSFGEGLEILSASDPKAKKALDKIANAEEERRGSDDAPKEHFFDHLGNALVPQSDAHLVLNATKVAGSKQETHIIHVIHVIPDRCKDTVSVSAPQVDVLVSSNSSIVLVEEIVGGEHSKQQEKKTARMLLPRARIVLEPHASMEHFVVHNGADNKEIVVKTACVAQAEKSSYSNLEVRVGFVPRGSDLSPERGCLSRSEINVLQTGVQTETHLKSLALLVTSNTKKSSNPVIAHELRTKVNLNHRDGIVSQLGKIVTSGAASHGVFDGQVNVKRAAQGTDAAQLARALLLTRGATVNARPNLKIEADDVKAAHGCTVADLDDDQLFYLASRGIDARIARSILIGSFVNEISTLIPYNSISDRVNSAIADALDQCEL